MTEHETFTLPEAAKEWHQLPGGVHFDELGQPFDGISIGMPRVRETLKKLLEAHQAGEIDPISRQSPLGIERRLAGVVIAGDEALQEGEAREVLELEFSREVLRAYADSIDEKPVFLFGLASQIGKENAAKRHAADNTLASRAASAIEKWVAEGMNKSHVQFMEDVREHREVGGVQPYTNVPRKTLSREVKAMLKRIGRSDLISGTSEFRRPK